MIWTFVFCLLTKNAGLHWASRQSLWAWDLSVASSQLSLATQRAKAPFLASDPMSSLHISEGLSHRSSDIIMGCFLLLEESTYCQGESSCIIFLCSRNDLVVTRGCLELSDRSLGTTWDTVHGALLFWWGNVYPSSFHFWAERCQSQADTQVLLVLPVGKHSFLQTGLSKFFWWRKLIP